MSQTLPSLGPSSALPLLYLFTAERVLGLRSWGHPWWPIEGVLLCRVLCAEEGVCFLCRTSGLDITRFHRSLQELAGELPNIPCILLPDGIISADCERSRSKMGSGQCQTDSFPNSKGLPGRGIVSGRGGYPTAMIRSPATNPGD